MPLSGGTIAGIVIVVIVVVVYVTLALLHNTWNPVSKKFWVGEKKEETKQCKEGEVTIKDGLLVPCTVTKEGFSTTGMEPDQSKFMSIPVSQRNSILTKPESEQKEFFKSISSCMQTNSAVYCDVTKPIDFWYHKGAIEHTFKYELGNIPMSSRPPKPGRDAQGRPDLTDANWIKVSTYNELQEMWNTLKKEGDKFDADREKMKEVISFLNKMFKVNWKVKPITLTVTNQDGTSADFVPGVDVPWGIFLGTASIVEVVNKTWPTMTLSAEDSEIPEKLPQGRLIYNFLAKLIGNKYQPESPSGSPQ
jgi:hypothetical protein